MPMFKLTLRLEVDVITLLAVLRSMVLVILLIS
jgi:hypothetical protein